MTTHFVAKLDDASEVCTAGCSALDHTIVDFDDRKQGLVARFVHAAALRSYLHLRTIIKSINRAELVLDFGALAKQLADRFGTAAVPETARWR